ncbi:MAG TPA: MFS transporter, partial [Bradyrhizobium sp.]
MASPGIAEETVVPLRTGSGISRYAWYVLALLLAAAMMSFLDRMIFSLLIDPIRKDLALTDTNVSLLAGVAFAVCYVLFAFPFGRFVDSHARNRVVALGVVMFSLGTIACGLATGFAGLFGARMIIGIGEASLNPATISLVPDYVPERSRALAMSVLTSGNYVGTGLAMLLGGELVQWAARVRPILPVLGALSSWKLSFLGVGMPGLLLALLIFLTLREPQRQLTASAVDSETPTLADCFAYLRRHAKLFALIFTGFSALAVNAYAFLVWGPVFLMRVHGYSPAQAGLVFAIAIGIGGTVSTLLGGVISDRMRAGGQIDGPVRVSLWASVVMLPFFVIGYLIPAASVSVVTFVIAMLIASIIGGIQFVMVQAITPNRMRGIMGALYGACVNLAGLGIAPTLIALMTDHLFGGPAGIGRSLAAMSTLSLIVSAACLLLGIADFRARALS